MLELIRALEVVQNYALIQPLYAWRLQYGEINVLGSRVDAILLLLSGNDEVQQRVGFEIISSEKDIREARAKLSRLIMLGELDKAYIYRRRLDEVHKEIVDRLKLFEEVGL